MQAQPDPLAPWPVYVAQTRNISPDRGGSIHKDDVAQSYGFKGALVAGRAVFSHLVHPLLERFGEAFLTRGTCEVRFFRPAYEGDTITVQARTADPGDEPRHVLSVATNGEGVELAKLEASLPEPFPASDPRGLGAFPEPTGTRVEVTPDSLKLGQPWPVYRTSFSRDDQVAWCDQIGETLPLFRAGDAPPLHPGLVPTATTSMLHQNLIVSGWVHASSLFITHRLVRTGTSLEVRTTPVERWERKGREFAKLHAAFVADGEVVIEEFRTAIINLSKRD